MAKELDIKNTGSGGFPLPEGGDLNNNKPLKVYYYDQGKADGATPSGVENSDKIINVDLEPEEQNDLSHRTRNTLKNYIKSLSAKQTRIGFYPVGGNTAVENDAASIYPDPNGSPPRVSGVEEGQEHYTQNISEDVKLKLDSVSEDYIESKGQQTPFQLDKGQGENNGNSFLLDLSDDTKKNLKTYTNVVLKRNRFSDSNLQVDLTGTDEDEIIKNNYLVVGSKSEKVETLGKNSAAGGFTGLTPQKMKAIGPALTLTATSERVITNLLRDGWNNLASDDYQIGGGSLASLDPSSTFSKLESLLPGLSQLGLVTPYTDWIPGFGKDDLKVLVDTIDDEPTIDDLDISGTWGVLNNVNEGFSSGGLSAISMVLLSIVLVASVNVALELVSIVGLLLPSGGTVHKNVPGEYNYKKFGPWDMLPKNVLGLMGFESVSGNYATNTLKGMSEFFGGVGGLSGITKIFDDPAYVEKSGAKIVAARAIIRSGITFVSELYKSFTSPTGPANLLGFRNNKFISYVNLFAKLGAELDKPGRNLVYAPVKHPNGEHVISFIDSAAAALEVHRNADIELLKSEQPTTGSFKILNYADFKASRRLKKQGSGFKISMSWSVSEAPHLLLNNPLAYVVPAATNNYNQLKDKLDSTRQPLKKSDNWNHNNKIISPEKAMQWEKYLNGEYMPFYIRDMRTNEIVSFHAFLESITDGYSASYDTHDAIGRVEAIKTYKSTQRKFGFSFYMVSTGPDDILDLYEKVNKLTTLVYPQFTRGKKIIDQTGYTYRQPFSQIPAAAPMVRVKIGDVARSNYSRFDLARLFGFGNTGEVYDSSRVVVTPARYEDVEIDQIELIKLYQTENPNVSLRFVTEGALYGKSSAGKQTDLDHLRYIFDQSATDDSQLFFNLKCPEHLLLSAGGTWVTVQEMPFKDADPVNTAVQAEVSKKQYYVGVTRSGGKAKLPSSFVLERWLPRKNPQANANTSLGDGWSAKDGEGVYLGDPKAQTRSQHTYRFYYTNVEKQSPDVESTHTSFWNWVKIKIDGLASITLNGEIGTLDYRGKLNPGDNFLHANIQDIVLKKKVKEEKRTPLNPPPDPVYFDPGNNMIVKSFENNAGSGLAGFIESLDFDWDVKLPWETRSVRDEGSTSGVPVKGPKMCKVTISFSPIHDITPGIDHNGVNRAPIY